MRKIKMVLYEGMYIFRSTLSDPAREQAVGKVTPFDHFFGR